MSFNFLKIKVGMYYRKCRYVKQFLLLFLFQFNFDLVIVKNWKMNGNEIEKLAQKMCCDPKLKTENS